MTKTLRVILAATIISFAGFVVTQANQRSAVFPSVEVVKYLEHSAANRRIHRQFGQVTVRVKNKGTTATDPVSLSIKDSNQLMRGAKPIRVPSLRPGASQIFTIGLEAEGSGLEPTAEWHGRYRAKCGPQLVSVLDLTGSLNQEPRNRHFEDGLTIGSDSGPQMQVDPYVSICDGNLCVKPCLMAKDIRKQLDGHVVGYSFFVGLNSEYGSYGKARTSADAVLEKEFTSKTKITVASVSKLVTTIAAVRILQRNNISLDAKIGPYFPSDWSVGDYVSDLTFAQLLSHTSGIKDYGNVNTDYAKLKQFFTQSVSTTATISCQGWQVVDPSNPINTHDTNRCYSNYNFAIFRILLPKVAGLDEESDLNRRPVRLANQYQNLVRENVFDLVGQSGVACKPPFQTVGNSNYAFGYKYPGTSPGADWGDESLKCGAVGWYLSVEDIAKVLLSINARDNKILREDRARHSFEDMRTRHLGWDIDRPDQLEKNGGYDSCGSNFCGEISTSVSIFGPVTGPRLVAVLFINSNISGGLSDGGGARGVLQKAYTNSLFPKP